MGSYECLRLIRTCFLIANYCVSVRKLLIFWLILCDNAVVRLCDVRAFWGTTAFGISIPGSGTHNQGMGC